MAKISKLVDPSYLIIDYCSIKTKRSLSQGPVLCCHQASRCHKHLLATFIHQFLGEHLPVTRACR